MTKIQKEIPMEKLMSRQIKAWQIGYDPGQKFVEKEIKPCITISKELGSRGVELGHELSDTLHWKFFDKDLVEYIAKDAKVRKEMVEAFDEKTQNEIHTWVHTLLSRYALASDKYFKYLVTALTGIARHGHAIILGRGANFVLSAQRTLRIRTIASTECRIHHLVNRLNVEKSEALKIISKADTERKAFIKRFFKHEADDLLFYDMVLNMDDLRLDSAKKIVLTVLKEKFS